MSNNNAVELPHQGNVTMLADGFARVDELIPGVLHDLAIEELLWRPTAEANPIGWLVWHLTRVLDDHVAGIAGTPQMWLSDGWVDRFGLPYPEKSIGYGQTSDEVGAFTLNDSSVLLPYWDATFNHITQLLEELQDGDLERVVDDSYDPPVTVAVRLVSVLNDVTQHVGQAAYVRGLLPRHHR
ncbi:mycothiol transferase [Tessaracoccus sp.]